MAEIFPMENLLRIQLGGIPCRPSVLPTWTSGHGENLTSYEPTAHTVKFLGHSQWAGRREGKGRAPIWEPLPGAVQASGGVYTHVNPYPYIGQIGFKVDRLFFHSIPIATFGWSMDSGL